MEPESFEFVSCDFLGNGVAGQEGDAETFAGGALDRLARIEFPDVSGSYASLRERVVADLSRARRCAADEERLLGECGSCDCAIPQR